MSVVANLETNSLELEDMGVTVRTLLWAASEGYKTTGKRYWSLRYKGAVIGKIQVRTTDANRDPTSNESSYGKITEVGAKG